MVVRTVEMNDRTVKQSVNRGTEDRKKRAKLRKRLQAEGLNPDLIDKIIAQQAFDDLVAREGLDRARYHAYINADRREDVDDTGYEPSVGDPLLRGPARVDGVAAKVVRRRGTITEFQYDRETGK